MEVKQKKKKYHFRKKLANILADIHSGINEINEGNANGIVIPNFGHKQ